jgi:queuosine precursor transporter
MYWLVAYVASIALANFMIAHVGTVCRGPEGPCLVPVGFGLLATSGTLAIGLSFTFRDLTQEALGRWWTLGGIVLGAALSVLTSSPQVALASGLTLLVSETADFAVYTPLRARHWLGAVFASNVVGLTVDTVLFLTLAFGVGSLGLMWGQMVGKVEMTVLAVAVLWLWRRRHAVSERRGAV